MTAQDPGARPDWIAVDWGTSHLRVWPMRGGTPLTRLQSDRGMGQLSPDTFEATLVSLLGDWLAGIENRLPVLVCGMAGARQGWREAPYAAVPCTPPVTGVPVETVDPRLAVTILPGLSQTQPADVMRGEETQIGGFLRGTPGFDGVICLPGTHTKWAHVSAQEVVSFRTFMTGELFALLSKQSVLRFSMGEGWDDAAFGDAVGDAMARPATLAADLFGLRAATLLEGLSPGAAKARLSGLLIGVELAGARPYWLGQEIVILGEDGMAGAYRDALVAQGAQVRCVPVDDMTLAGLIAAREKT
ncbi:2-dehydro-3-deoxygalactonokinase [Sagittula salina]|uniref:2-dehydro-3-deoxygalactonokinase n=1 Tax=Sagittula salina TaxID=2820268 RepID=A0A940S3U2_9RHOB|nr:2-dehydro-3-deoxygalactonokinase [Sagittula salina]MBP0483170.1 2-dehydro-3-deoxygalactonokinase [Sagittula salina]